jgi:hypothetical protein
LDCPQSWTPAIEAVQIFRVWAHPGTNKVRLNLSRVTANAGNLRQFFDNHLNHDLADPLLLTGNGASGLLDDW